MNLFRTKQANKAISGEARASKDMVKLDVTWPHEFSQNVSVNYSDRVYGLIQLVRGEICILSNVETVFSKDRQLHLFNLLYLAEKFPIVEIKAYHENSDVFLPPEQSGVFLFPVKSGAINDNYLSNNISSPNLVGVSDHSHLNIRSVESAVS